MIFLSKDGGHITYDEALAETIFYSLIPNPKYGVCIVEADGSKKIFEFPTKEETNRWIEANGYKI